MLLQLLFRAPSACLSFSRGICRGCVVAARTALREAKFDERVLFYLRCVCVRVRAGRWGSCPWLRFVWHSCELCTPVWARTAWAAKPALPSPSQTCFFLKKKKAPTHRKKVDVRSRDWAQPCCAFATKICQWDCFWLLGERKKKVPQNKTLCFLNPVLPYLEEHCIVAGSALAGLFWKAFASPMIISLGLFLPTSSAVEAKIIYCIAVEPKQPTQRRSLKFLQYQKAPTFYFLHGQTTV